MANNTPIVARAYRRDKGSSGKYLRLLAPLLAIALAGIVTAAIVIMGPSGPGSNQQLGQATPQLNGLATEPLYGDVVSATNFTFTVTVTQNSYQIAEDMRPVVRVANLTVGTDIVLVGSFDGVTYSFTNPTVTVSGLTFSYDFGMGFQRNVGPGATDGSAPTWFFTFHYTVSRLPAPVVTYSAQFAAG
jgi:hypothetical protein